eukprot:gene2249-1409_t
MPPKDLSQRGTAPELWRRSSHSYINATVTDNIVYPTPYAEDVAKDALRAAKMYYDLFFEHAPQPAPEPPKPSPSGPSGASHHAGATQQTGSGGTITRAVSHQVVNTPYHTFFPPVLLPAQRRRIIETILGKPSRSFQAWRWRRAADFEVILSTHDEFLRAVADRGPEGLPSLTHRPTSAKKSTAKPAAAATRSSAPIPVPGNGKPGRSSGPPTPSLSASAPPRPSSSSGPPAPRTKGDTSANTVYPQHNNFFYSFPASHQGPEYFSNRSEEGSARLVIVMVGLPARGKTFLAQKICRLLGWHGERGTVFNLQAAWRQSVLLSSPDKSPWVAADCFRRLLQDPKSDERRCYLNVLDEFAQSGRQFFEDLGKVIVLNDDFVSHDLRMEAEKRFRELGTQYFYIEMMRDSSQNDIYNEFKVHDSMEYPELVNRDVARKDFEERVKILEEMYEPLDDMFRIPKPSGSSATSTGQNTPSRVTPDIHRRSAPRTGTESSDTAVHSYITIRDAHTVEVHGIEGYLASRIVSYLMNISQKKIQHPIYFVRHGQSCYNLEDRIGGNPLLTEQGMKDSAALLEFLDSLKRHLAEEEHGDAAGSAGSAADADTSRLEIWTSQLQRAIQTAELSERLLNIKTLRWSSLNEIHAGVCEELTYAEVRSKYNLIDHFRKENKYTFRYPGGESYQDLVMRLEPVIMELENANKVVVVVAHQAILRCLLAYFGSVSAESSIRVKVPHRVVWRCTYDSKGVARLDEIVLDNTEAGSFIKQKPPSRRERHVEEGSGTAPPEETVPMTTHRPTCDSKHEKSEHVGQGGQEGSKPSTCLLLKGRAPFFFFWCGRSNQQLGLSWVNFVCWVNLTTNKEGKGPRIQLCMRCDTTPEVIPIEMHKKKKKRSEKTEETPQIHATGDRQYALTRTTKKNSCALLTLPFRCFSFVFQSSHCSHRPSTSLSSQCSSFYMKDDSLDRSGSFRTPLTPSRNTSPLSSYPGSPTRLQHHLHPHQYVHIHWGPTPNALVQTAAAQRELELVQAPVSAVSSFIAPPDEDPRHHPAFRPVTLSCGTSFSFAPFTAAGAACASESLESSTAAAESSAEPSSPATTCDSQSCSAQHQSAGERSAEASRHTAGPNATEEGEQKNSASAPPSDTSGTSTRYSQQAIENALTYDEYAALFGAFRTLGLPVTGQRGAAPPADAFDREYIKESFRTLVRRLHPDLEGGDAAKMEQVNAAYQQLKQCTPLQQAGYVYWLRECRGKAIDVRAVAEEAPSAASQEANETVVSEVVAGSFYVTVLCLGFGWGAMSSLWRWAGCEGPLAWTASGLQRRGAPPSSNPYQRLRSAFASIALRMGPLLSRAIEFGSRAVDTYGLQRGTPMGVFSFDFFATSFCSVGQKVRRELWLHFCVHRNHHLEFSRSDNFASPYFFRSHSPLCLVFVRPYYKRRNSCVATTNPLALRIRHRSYHPNNIAASSMFRPPLKCLLRCRVAGRLGSLPLPGGQKIRCGPAWHPVGCTSARWQSSAASRRRPTLAEVSNAMEVLGVTLDMSPKEWKSCYRLLAKRHHPDAGGDADTMTRITVAYEVLTTLTPREREELKLALRHGGGSTTSTAAARHNTGTRAGSQRPEYRYAYASTPGDAAPGARGEKQSSSYRMDCNEPFSRQRDYQDAFWSFYARHSSQGNYRSTGSPHARENPTNHYGRESSTFNPFQIPFYHGMRPLQRARFMRSRQLMIRGIAAYLFFVALFLFIYRVFRDRRDAYEWRLAEHLSRHERYQALHTNSMRRAAPAEDEVHPRLDHRALWRVMRWQEEQRAMAERLGWPAVPAGAGSVQQTAEDIYGVMLFQPSRGGVPDTQRNAAQRAAQVHHLEDLHRPHAAIQEMLGTADGVPKLSYGFYTCPEKNTLEPTYISSTPPSLHGRTNGTHPLLLQHYSSFLRELSAAHLRFNSYMNSALETPVAHMRSLVSSGLTTRAELLELGFTPEEVAQQLGSDEETSGTALVFTQTSEGLRVTPPLAAPCPERQVSPAVRRKRPSDTLSRESDGLSSCRETLGRRSEHSTASSVEPQPRRPFTPGSPYAIPFSSLSAQHAFSSLPFSSCRWDSGVYPPAAYAENRNSALQFDGADYIAVGDF